MDNLETMSTCGNSPSLNRDIALDYGKGFAIILIVLYHIYGYTNREVGSIVNSFCYIVQLPIFFYISGLLTNKKQSHNINLKKRAIRLLVPFIFFYTTWCIINYNNLHSFIQDEFKGGYWFTLVLFEMTAILSLSYYLSNKYNKNVIFVQISLFLLLTLYVYIIPKGNIINTILSINLLWHYSPFFYLGLYYSKFEIIIKPKYLFIYTISYFLSQYLFFISNNRLLTPFCNLLSLLLFITLFRNGYRLFEPYISYIGKYSIQIYLIHFFFLHYFAQFIPLISNRFTEFVVYIVLCFVLILVIIGLSKIIMRNKWARLIFFGIY